VAAEGVTSADEEQQQVANSTGSRDANWEAQLVRLAAYKAAHGDCSVPQNWAEDPRLGRWVNTQRRSKAKPNEGMTAAREAKLDDLGFAWVSSRARGCNGSESKMSWCDSCAISNLPHEMDHNRCWLCILARDDLKLDGSYDALDRPAKKAAKWRPVKVKELDLGGRGVKVHYTSEPTHYAAAADPQIDREVSYASL
jgi:hypothetical protein